MTKGINLIGQLLKFAISILGIILCAIIIGKADTTASVADQILNYGFNLDGAFYLVYLAGALCMMVIAFFAIKHVIHHPKSLIGVGAFALVLAISYYGLSDNEVIEDFYPEGTTPLVSQLVGGGLIALYIVGVGAIVAILYAEVSKLFK